MPTMYLVVSLLLAPMMAAGTPVEGTNDLQRLVVRVVGIESDKGSMALALYDSSDRYDAREEPLRAAFLPIEDKSCEWVLDGLEEGTYALMVYHDRNGNGVLDRRRLFGIPKEPYGFSNDASAATGPPGFQKAAFEVAGGERVLEIRLR